MAFGPKRKAHSAQWSTEEGILRYWDYQAGSDDDDVVVWILSAQHRTVGFQAGLGEAASCGRLSV